MPRATTFYSTLDVASAHAVERSARPASSRRQARQRLGHRLRQALIRLPNQALHFRPGPRTLSVVLATGCAALLYLFSTADAFYVEKVVVEGNSTVTAGEVAQASGAGSYNIFFLQFGDVEQRVRAIPAVRDAHAWYEWPNVVHVSVVERTPAFGWESNQHTSWVDETGTLFDMTAPLTATLTVHDADNKARQRLDPALMTALKAIALAAPALKRIDFADAGGLSFADEHGWRILVGQPDQIGAKLSMLKALSEYVAAQKIDVEYLDVRLPERAFYKPK